MKIIKLDDRHFMVEWKYKDFLRIGHQFQGSTIVKLERKSAAGSDHVVVTVEDTQYKI